MWAGVIEILVWPFLPSLIYLFTDITMSLQRFVKNLHTKVSIFMKCGRYMHRFIEWHYNIFELYHNSTKNEIYKRWFARKIIIHAKYKWHLKRFKQHAILFNVLNRIQLKKKYFLPLFSKHLKAVNYRKMLSNDANR